MIWAASAIETLDQTTFNNKETYLTMGILELGRASDLVYLVT